MRAMVAHLAGLRRAGRVKPSVAVRAMVSHMDEDDDSGEDMKHYAAQLKAVDKAIEDFDGEEVAAQALRELKAHRAEVHGRLEAAKARKK